MPLLRSYDYLVWNKIEIFATWCRYWKLEHTSCVRSHLLNRHNKKFMRILLWSGTIPINIHHICSLLPQFIACSVFTVSNWWTLENAIFIEFWLWMKQNLHIYFMKQKLHIYFLLTWMTFPVSGVWNVSITGNAVLNTLSLTNSHRISVWTTYSFIKQCREITIYSN